MVSLKRNTEIMSQRRRNHRLPGHENAGSAPTLSRRLAVIGLRTKTGRAIAIVLGGPVAAPQGIYRAELKMASPQVPATYQPYHEVMELPWDQAEEAVRDAVVAIEAAASDALAGLVRDVRDKGFKVAGVAIVGAPARRLESIGNPHIRAHAAEGVVYRHALETAAAANDLEASAFVEKGLLESVQAALGLSENVVRSNLARVGEELGRPWRADEKLAAMAAWVVLNANGKKA
jgi:hypothetical protein